MNKSQYRMKSLLYSDSIDNSSVNSSNSNTDIPHIFVKENDYSVTYRIPTRVIEARGIENVVNAILPKNKGYSIHVDRSVVTIFKSGV